MKVIVVSILLFCGYVWAERDYIEDAKKIVKKANQKKKVVLEENLKRFQDKKSQGGITVTEIEFQSLKMFSEDEFE